MVKVIRTKDPQFPDFLRSLVTEKRENAPDINRVVAAIIEDIRVNGDKALIEYTQRFDRFPVAEAKDFCVSKEQIKAAVSACPQPLIQALQQAASRIRSYHERQLPQDVRYTDAEGVELGFRWTAMGAVGIYVPGGLASYPSSVLMNAIPAVVAGVKRIAMVVPAPEGKLNPAVLAAASIAGVTEIYMIGGAQAVAALAHGTATIAPVDIIVGPGNAYVAAAKRQLYGTVGIDMIAGPSEVLVVSDRDSNPEWIAADLLSQAEHDEAARSILITDDRLFADTVIEAVERMLPTLQRQAIARKSWENQGSVIIAQSLSEAPAIIDVIAPEHLELAVDNPEALAKKVQNAGAIFLGRYTPEAVGDYLAGPSHVLPTAATARFASGLSVFDFLKRTSLISCSATALDALSSATRILAETEGLGAHALSVAVRTPSRQKNNVLYEEPVASSNGRQ